MTENNAINKQTEDLTVNKASGDPFVTFQIASVDKWSMGADDDDSDEFKITDGADPSSGNTRLRIDSSGYVYVPSGEFFSQGTNVGGPAQLQAINLDGTNANSSARLTLKTTSGGGSTYSLCDNPAIAGNAWKYGVERATTYFKINNYCNSGLPNMDGTNVWLMRPSGIRTMPLQPAFLAWLTNVEANVTGDGTNYTWGTTGMTEIFDQNADFNAAGTFTAPVTGRYSFISRLRIGGIAAQTQFITQIITSNRAYSYYVGNPGNMKDSGNALTGEISCLADMDAADTALLRTQVCGGAKGISISASTAANQLTAFSGRLEV